MNPTKVLDFLSDLWAKHAPTVLMHVMLFLAIRVFVLDPGNLVGGLPVWSAIKQGLAFALNELGFTKVERGYALAAIGLVYLTMVLWAASFLASLPYLAPALRYRIDPDRIVLAGAAFRTDPGVYLVRERLDDAVEAYKRRFIERKQPYPYEWVEAQCRTWHRYYGLCLLTTLGSLVWWWWGSIGARSPAHVLKLAAVTFLAALFARWKTRERGEYQRSGIEMAAIMAHEKESGQAEEPNELRLLRTRLLKKDAEIEIAVSRHPLRVIRRLAFHLPSPLRGAVMKALDEHLEYPPYYWSGNWRLMQSQVLRHGESSQSVPAALNAEAFKERFRGLLECQGAGICLLVDSMSGLAPSVRDGGASYSFANRNYEYDEPGIRYHRFSDSRQTFSVSNFGKQWGWLSLIGPYPIELLAQREFHHGSGGGESRKLADQHLDTKAWNAKMFEGEGAQLFGMTLRESQPVVPGASYLYRCMEKGGAEVVIVFQCFRVVGTEKIFLAWKILDIFHDKGETAPILPCWNPKAWRGMFRKRMKPGNPA